MKSRTADSCGCALSARFLAIAFLTSSGYYGWQLSSDALSLGNAVARVALITFVAAAVGKAIGIMRYRWRRKPLLREAR